MSTAITTNAQAELQDMIRRSAARRSKKMIRARIDEIIRKYQSRNRCRLSDEEIVLLALAYSSDEWLSLSQIGEFAFSNVRFFQRQAAQFFFGRTYGQGIHDLSRCVQRYVHSSYSFHPLSDDMLTKHSSYLRTYGIPVYSKHDLNRPQAYMMTAGAAYNYLEAFSSKRGAFNLTASVKDAASCSLMKLPNELLLEICRLVVKVPGHRLLVGNKSFSAYDEQTPIWASRAQDSLTMPPVQDFLALLSVNKQVREYAMPVLFYENHFQFRDMRSMKTFLHNIGPERRKWMRNVSVSYTNLSFAAAGARLLAESEHLQKLTLIMSATQDPAGHFTINSGRRKFSTLTQVPGVSSLKRLRGLQQLTFDPNLAHAVLDAFLRPIVTQPKAVKKVKKTVKRKIESNDETAAAAAAAAAAAKEPKSA
jgi:hypothetical protein